MSLVESELNKRNFELQKQSAEFEKRKENEHKLTPLNPEVLEQFRRQSIPIEQIYLSTPEDSASLRVRAVYKPEGIEHSATQKSDGELMDDGALSRPEINTSISQNAFEMYQALPLPRVFKLRATIEKGVTVDFYDDEVEPVLVEVEHSDPVERARLLAMVQELTGNTLVDRSGDPSLSNEAMAFRQYKKRYGKEFHSTPESLDTLTERILREMVAQYVTGKNSVVVGLSGMSGSGKTTVTTTLQERIVELFGEKYKPVVLSSDDYHFGKKFLNEKYGAPYKDWDAARTYNTSLLATDIGWLQKGLHILKNRFDFDSQEPVFDKEVTPSPFIIIEGLYAASKDLENVLDIHEKLPTTIGTSVERDLRRLVIDTRANDEFPDPESRLKYLIESAIPEYMSQVFPERKRFSESSRPMAKRAFMLARLNEMS